VEICKLSHLRFNAFVRSYNRIVRDIFRGEIMHVVLMINDERKLHIFSVMTGAHWLDLYLDGSHVQTYYTVHQDESSI